jgi:hypothetical protein
MLTSGGDLDPAVQTRVFWAVTEGLVAIALLTAGGDEALARTAGRGGVGRVPVRDPADLRHVEPAARTEVRTSSDDLEVPPTCRSRSPRQPAASRKPENWRLREKELAAKERELDIREAELAAQSRGDGRPG